MANALDRTEATTPSRFTAAIDGSLGGSVRGSATRASRRSWVDRSLRSPRVGDQGVDPIAPVVLLVSGAARVAVSREML
jgi:hypothetical protein